MFGPLRATVPVLLLVLPLAAVGACVLAIPPAALNELSVGAIERLLANCGPWTVPASIGLMVLHSFIPFPAEAVAIANGMLYGPWIGFAVTWVAGMIGACLAFGLARRWGAPFALKWLPPRHHLALEGWVDRNAATTLIAARLIPVVSFNLVNYAAGLAGVPWHTFLWTTGLGITPMTALMVWLGVRTDKLTTIELLIVFSGLIVSWLVIRRWRRNRRLGSMK